MAGEMPKALRLLISALNLIMPDLGAALNQAWEDGKISYKEVDELVLAVADVADKFLGPESDDELELVRDLARAYGKYTDAQGEEPPAEGSGEDVAPVEG